MPDRPMIYCGTYVRNRLTGQRGRVHQVLTRMPYRSDDALKRREPTLGPNPMRFINSRWVQYLAHSLNNDGVDDYRQNVSVPVELLDKIEPFDYKNDDARVYFRDMAAGGPAPSHDYEYPNLHRTWWAI